MFHCQDSIKAKITNYKIPNVRNNVPTYTVIFIKAEWICHQTFSFENFIHLYNTVDFKNAWKKNDIIYYTNRQNESGKAVLNIDSDFLQTTRIYKRKTKGTLLRKNIIIA